MPSPAYIQRRSRPEPGNPRPHTTTNTHTKEPKARNISAKLDLGKGPEPINIKKTRERVMNWQSDNSDAVTPSEAGAPSEDGFSEDSDEQPLPRGRSRTYTQLFAANRQGNGTGFRVFGNTSPLRSPIKPDYMDADVRAASKPKRRLVNDDHWKKTKIAPEESLSDTPPPPPPQPVFTPPRNSSVAPVKIQSGKMEFEYNVISRSPDKGHLDAWTRSKPKPVEQPPKPPPEKKHTDAWVRPKDTGPVKEWKVHTFPIPEGDLPSFPKEHRHTRSVEKLRSNFTEPAVLASPRSTGDLKPRAKSMPRDKERGYDSDRGPAVEIHKPSKPTPKQASKSPVQEKVQKFNTISPRPRKIDEDHGRLAREVVKNNRAAFEFFAGRMPSPEKNPEPKKEKEKVAPKEKEPLPKITREAAFDWIVGKDVRARADAAKRHLVRWKEDPPKGPELKLHNKTAIDNMPGGPRISSWLGDMPDPFTDNPKRLRKAAAAPPSDVDEDDEFARKKERRREREERDAQYERRRRRKHEDNPSNALELAIPIESSPVQSQVSTNPSTEASPTPPTLKRRGAKRDTQSPRRKSRRPESSDPESDVRTEFTMPGGSVVPGDSVSVRDWSQPAPAPKGLRSLFHRNKGSTMSPEESMRVARQEAAMMPASSGREANVAVVLPSQARTSKPQRPGVKRNLASHDDLMSVLSMQPDQGRVMRSACSVRSARSKAGSGSLSEVLSEIKAEEGSYLQELQTLIDGVIPVLLSCVMSKTGSSATTGLFGPKSNATNATTPIVNMGIALERLRSVHKRFPYDNVDALLSWAKNAHQVYSDYIRSWRMGFRDVEVNLAPAEDGSKPLQKDVGLPLKSEGYVTNSRGQKFDVAFLLKRPLVRLRYLAKAFKGIAQSHSSAVATEWADKYQDLVSFAKKRQREELARLEDEAAASIDITRTRDPSTLAPLAGVSVEPNMCVRARDLFNLQLNHSTGQRLDCRVEIIIRDNPASQQATGDILICEIDHAGRWLLLPPFQLGRVSARRGTEPGELVVMIRGSGMTIYAWHEVLCLRPDQEQTSTEWLQMLGSDPMPRPVPQIRPALTLKNVDGASASSLGESLKKISPSEVDVPMGEQASVVSRQWGSRPSSGDFGKPGRADASPDGRKSSRPTSMPPPRSSHLRENLYGQATTSPKALDEALYTAGSHNSLPSRPKLDRHPHHASTAPSSPQDQRHKQHDGHAGSSNKHKWLPDWTKKRSEPPPAGASSNLSRSSGGHPVWLPPQNQEGSGEDYRSGQNTPPANRVCVAPSEDLPSIPKARPTYSDYGRSNVLRRKEVPVRGPVEARKPDQSPTSPAPKTSQQPPEMPPHPSPVQLGSPTTPKLTPPSSGPRTHRRSSSPLKHEYALSDSPSDHSVDGNTMSDDDADDISSVSSADDIVPSLPPMTAFNRKPPHSVYSPKNAGTIAPSQSASQAPYRTVPETSAGGVKQIASIFCWSNKGIWEPLHENECSIIVSPGLIEAFEMSAAHSGERPQGINPLIGLELTPLVPLRRGTAIDISIRSPPTAISQLKPSTSNIMFRSRTNIECENLYNMINQARINNPTYMALQNARPPGESNWGAFMDARANEKPSWWRAGRKRSSYRAGSSRRTPSIAGQTESSVASMSSAISALRRFSSGSKAFNVAKSTVLPRDGSRSISTFSSSEDGPSGASTPPAGVGRGLVLDPSQGTPLGIAGSKIRLYAREGAGRWRDMGSARLTIMHPPRPPGAPPPLAPDGSLKSEKRVFIVGKTRGETLLDVTLGETSFERVARTGIALSVWERADIAKRGSVMTGRVKVFMIQMKGEAETAYTFSLVGRLRC